MSGFGADSDLYIVCIRNFSNQLTFFRQERKRFIHEKYEQRKFVKRLPHNVYDVEMRMVEKALAERDLSTLLLLHANRERICVPMRLNNANPQKLCVPALAVSKNG